MISDSSAQGARSHRRLLTATSESSGVSETASVYSSHTGNIQDWVDQSATRSRFQELPENPPPAPYTPEPRTLSPDIQPTSCGRSCGLFKRRAPSAQSKASDRSHQRFQQLRPPPSPLNRGRQPSPHLQNQRSPQPSRSPLPSRSPRSPHFQNNNAALPGWSSPAPGPLGPFPAPGVLPPVSFSPAPSQAPSDISHSGLGIRNL